MSAIYGRIHWGSEATKSKIVQMEECLKQYQIDRFGNEVYAEAVFGCGIQYFTQEAEREELPYKSEKEQVLITADVVLDNREELMEQLRITKPGVPDGRIVCMAYEKWGEEFVKLLRGVFAIAVYDRRIGKLFLYTDHTGSRALNYYIKGDTVVFSTTFAPILKLHKDIGLSEKWIVACESMQTPDMGVFVGLTPYEGVFQLEAGKYLSIDASGMEKKVYWDPTKTRRRMPFDDEVCKELFVTTFKQCVKDVLRSRSKTAATVSSGLDSTSVASLAAQFLEKEGKKLYTYTSVPDGDFESQDPFAIANEAWGPAALKKKYSNIESQLVPCTGMNGFTKLEYLVRQLEVPTKSAPNVMWIDEAYKLAREKDCRIILKGQYGNATISYGKILANIRYQLSKGHFVNAIKEMNAFGKKNGIPRKRIIKAYRMEMKNAKEKVDYISDSYVDFELLQRYNLNASINECVMASGGTMIDSEEQMRNFLFDQVSFAQLAVYDTHFSLIHGLLVRDPTKDKRMIELCMELPVECGAHNGVERRLVREYMKGIVPEEILLQVRRRGEQSADYVERVKRHWMEIREDVLSHLEKVKDTYYMKQDRMEDMISQLQCIEEKDANELSRLVACAFNFYAFAVLLDMQDSRKVE